MELQTTEQFEKLLNIGDKIKIIWNDGVIEESEIKKITDISRSCMYTYTILFDNRPCTASFTNNDIIKELCKVIKI